MSKVCKFFSVLFVIIGVLGGLIFAVTMQSFMSFLLPFFSGLVTGVLFAALAEILDRQDKIVELTGMVHRQLERLEKEKSDGK